MVISPQDNQHHRARVHADLQHLEALAQLMDNKFIIPGTSIRFGMDSLLGLIPGIGDTVTLLVTLYLTHQTKHYNLPGHLKARMYWNTFIDWLIGLVPFAGDIFDVSWKANLRNVELIRQHIQKKHF